MLPILAFMLFSSLASGASAIYEAVARVYGWQNYPKGEGGLFFGFAGCTRKVLEYALQVMRDTFNVWSVKTGAVSRNASFDALASQIAEETGADASGIKRFLVNVYVAMTKDTDVYNWLSGGDFTAYDNIKKVVSETVEEKATAITETVEYGLQKETSTGNALTNLVPVLGILGACYLVKKIVD